MFVARFLLLLFFALSSVSAQDSALRIVTASPLLPGIEGTAYLQNLAAAGGSPPYSWGASGTLPQGLTVQTSGSISGTPLSLGGYSFILQVVDSAGARVSQTVTMTVVAGGTLPRAGILTHIAAGGNWATSITLANSSPQPVAWRIAFYGDDGRPLTLPWTATQQGSARSASTSVIGGALNPNTTVVVDTGALSSTVGGWADVLSPGPIGGYAIFRSGTPGLPLSEGTVPLWTQGSNFVAPFDNTAGYDLGVALVNPSVVPADVLVTVWDDNGSPLGNTTFSLPGLGHTASRLQDLIPATERKRGIVKFQSSGSGGLSGIGLRFSPLFSFTSVPGV